MATITATGIGSGLDINGLLEQIVAAERAPTENRLNLKEANLQAELTAFGSLKGAVSSFQSSLGKLKSPAFFNSSDVSVSNTDILSASTSSVAQQGTYSVEVSSLARSHTLASVAFDSLDTVVGSGTLTFNFGTTVYDPGSSFAAGDDVYTSFTQNVDRSSQSVVIDNTNNTLSGIRDAINNAGIGVTAAIIDDGSGYRLLLSSDQQGIDNSLQISVDEGGAPADNIDTTGLSQLVFNDSATNVEQTQSAQNALITVNGLSISRESNSITGAIHGVTLNLLSAVPGQPVQVTVSNTNVAEAEKNITAFVNAFNDLATSISDMTAYNADTGKGGILMGDATARNIMQQIRRDLGGIIENDGAFNSLGSIGITTNRDGTLALNGSRLNTALKQDFDSVAQLFYANGTPSDSNVSFVGSSTATQDGNYRVTVDALASHGQLTGETISGPITIDAGNDFISLLVDGVSSGTVTLTQGVYNDLNSLAQMLEGRINSASSLQNLGINVSVGYVAGQLQISSGSYGANSSVSVALQNSGLGLTGNAVATAGSDVSGSIGSSPASGNGQLLSGTGPASGLVLEIAGTTTGNRGSVDYSRGIAGHLDSLLSRFLASDGQISSKTGSIQDQIEQINQQRTELDKRVAQIEDRYRRQFSALDVMLGQLQATGDYLQQQLDALPTLSVSKK